MRTMRKAKVKPIMQLAESSDIRYENSNSRLLSKICRKKSAFREARGLLSLRGKTTNRAAVFFDPNVYHSRCYL